MKVAIVNFKDLKAEECMSAAKKVEYTVEDFKNIDRISQDFGKAETDKDVRNMCGRVTRCTVKDCNLKQAVLDNKSIIMTNIRKKKEAEMKALMDTAEEQMRKIDQSSEKKEA